VLQEEIYGTGISIFLSLYPKNSAIASGATPIGSAVAHPIKKKSTEERREVRVADKEPVDGHVV
jgi:hypothetical protein